MCNIKAAETDPGNLKAHVNLGVSFTNELENERALHHLRMYIENNPEYAPLAATATGESEHDRVVDMFIQAAAQAPQDPQPRVVSLCTFPAAVCIHLTRSGGRCLGFCTTCRASMTRR